MRIKNLTFRYLLLAIIYLLLNGADCSKSKNEPTCYIPDEFKSYGVFNEGSYWVYHDQFNNSDTVTVKSNIHSIIDGPYSYPMERYEITTISTMRDESRYIAQCLDNPLMCTSFSILETLNPAAIQFFCCCDEGTRYENLQYISQLDSMVIHDETYYYVRIFESDSVNVHSLSKLYYAENIGLIQYEDYESNSWKLTKHSVSKPY
jgi:hypothetical protein